MSYIYIQATQGLNLEGSNATAIKVGIVLDRSTCHMTDPTRIHSALISFSPHTSVLFVSTGPDPSSACQHVAKNLREQERLLGEPPTKITGPTRICQRKLRQRIQWHGLRHCTVYMLLQERQLHRDPTTIPARKWRMTRRKGSR